MAPFLVFSVPSFDTKKRTIDIQIKSVGFSTILRTVSPNTHKVRFGTALSLMGKGKAHLSAEGLKLTLSYEINLGEGLFPVPEKYSSQINGALIPKLEAFVNKFFPPKLDLMLFLLETLHGRSKKSNLPPVTSP